MRRSRLALPLLFACWSCDSITDARVPMVRSIQLADPLTALVRELRVELASPASIQVDYWTDSMPRLRVSSTTALEHAVQLTRLRPYRTYHYNIVGSSATGTFRTAALPDDLRRLSFTATGNGSVPLVLLHLYDANGYRGYAIVDSAGNVVWYWRTVDFPFGAVRRGNGNFVFMDKGRGLVEVTAAGATVRELAQSNERDMHHDVITTPDNTLLFIAHDERVVEGVRVQGEAIWEWQPEAGSTTLRWTSWDHLSLTEDRGPRFGLEWMHANALAIGPRRNVLLSVHYFNQILSLTPDMTRVEWRLGGVNATIALAQADAFTGQHTPQELAGERLLLFDNAIERGGPSRAIEYELTGGSAQVRWQWIAPNDNFASAVSSARRLANGSTLIGFGMSDGLNRSTGGTEVFEVTSAGASVWRLRVEGTSVMFRAEPLSSVGTEVIVNP